MKLKDNVTGLEIELASVMDLAVAADLRDALGEALAAEGEPPVTLLGDGVERISTAAIQVLLAAHVAFKAASRPLALSAPSESLAAAFRHLGLGAVLETLITA